MQIYLGVGMGASDRLDLSDNVNYMVLPDGFRVDDDAADHRYVYVTLHLHVRGESKNDLLNARSAILTKLNQATIAGDGINDWVMLGVQLTGADSMAWWRVVEGGITEPGTLRGVFGNYIGSENGPLVLALRCWKGAFGEPIVDEPVAITGDNPTLYRAGIPGGMPAYAEMVLTDTSENDAVIHGIGIGSRSAMDMDDGDFVPFQPVEAVGIGSTEGDAEEPVADSFTGEIVTATPGINWQAMCYARPTEGQMRGAYDLWLRVRDEGQYLDAPLGLAGMASAGASMRQSTQSEGTTNSSATFATPTLAGNTLIAKVFSAVRLATPAVSSAPPGFSQVASRTHGGGDTVTRLVAMYVYPDAPSHVGEIAFTLTDATLTKVFIEEWSGLTADPVDVTATNATTNRTSHPTGTTPSTSQSDAIAMTMHAINRADTSGDDPSVAGYTSGYTQALNWWMRGGLIARQISHSRYRVLLATGTQSATLTSSVASHGTHLIAVFKSNPGGLLPAGNYQYRVSALDADGRESAAGATFAINHAVANSATQLEWQPSNAPGVTQYRVYVQEGTGAWVYWNTGTTTPTFLHRTMSDPDGTANPPDVGTESTHIRIGLALGPNGQITHRSAVVRPRLANGQWEWLRVSSGTLSPLPRPAGMPQPDYRIVVETRHPMGGDGLAVDVVAFAPSDESWADARVPALTAPREWVIGTNHAGQGYAWTRNPADGGDPSGATMTGRLAIGPGDTKLLFMLRGRNDVSLVEDASATVQLTIYPRNHWLIGST